MRFLRGVSGHRRTNRIGNQAKKKIKIKIKNKKKIKLHNGIENSRHVDVCFIKPKGKEANWKT